MPMMPRSSRPVSSTDGLLLESVEAARQTRSRRSPGTSSEKDETAEFRSFLAVDREHVRQRPSFTGWLKTATPTSGCMAVEAVAEPRGGVVSRVVMLADEGLGDLIRENLSHFVLRRIDHLAGRTPPRLSFFPPADSSPYRLSFLSNNGEYILESILSQEVKTEF